MKYEFEALVEVRYTDLELLASKDKTSRVAAYPRKRITVTGGSPSAVDSCPRALALAAKKFRREHLKAKRRSVVVGVEILQIAITFSRVYGAQQ